MNDVIDADALLLHVQEIVWQQAALRLWHVFEQFPDVESCTPNDKENLCVPIGGGEHTRKLWCKDQSGFLPQPRNDQFLNAVRENLASCKSGLNLIRILLDNPLSRATYWSQVETAYDKRFGVDHFKTARILADQDQLDQTLDKADPQPGKPFRL
jgi:hypothetical protein